MAEKNFFEELIDDVKDWFDNLVPDSWKVAAYKLKNPDARRQHLAGEISDQDIINEINAKRANEQSAELEKELDELRNDPQNVYVGQLQQQANEYQAAQDQLNRDFQMQSAERAMTFSATEAEKDRQWQEHMSNTAYQRSMTDLKAAGFNPMLAYMQGGASTPAGASASGVASSGTSSQYDTDQVLQMMQSNTAKSASISSSALSVAGMALSVILGKTGMAKAAGAAGTAARAIRRR